MKITTTLLAVPALVLVPTLLLLVAPGCSSSTTSTPTGDGSASTGLVSGPADTHCGAKKQAVSAAACQGADAGAEPDAGGDAGAVADDAGAVADDAGAVSEYGATLYNGEGDEDDCKYHVKWSAAAIAQRSDVAFTVNLASLADGAAVKGAPVRAEVFLDETHPAPNTTQTSVESASAPGTYSVGPIRFDAPGKWTVRFHFHEECEDGEESPHGHVAFFVQVP